MQDMTPKSSSEPARREPDWRDGQEEIDASKAPLMDHLIELRERLIKALVGIAIAFFICFFFATEIYNLLVKPYVWARMARGETDVTMIFTAPQEFFFTKLKVALFAAVCIAFPVIANQIYKFVAPGLYKNERDAFVPYLIATPVLFILGALCVYFLVMPMALEFFLGTEQKGGVGQATIKLEARVSEYLSLIMTMIIGFGICFQLPVILSILARAGVVDAEMLRGFRRYAIVAITAAAAVLSPPDPFSMIAMMLPTWLLYEASIFIVDRINPPEKSNKA